jgi:hypothetical protein
VAVIGREILIAILPGRNDPAHIDPRGAGSDSLAEPLAEPFPLLTVEIDLINPVYAKNQRAGTGQKRGYVWERFA